MPEPRTIARNIHRGLHDAGVTDYAKVLRWAFGPQYGKLRMRNWYKSWNRRHGKLFGLKKNVKLYVMCKRIGEAYGKV